MLRSDRAFLGVGVIAALLVGGIGFAWIFQTYIPQARVSASLEGCRKEVEGSLQIECIFRVIERELFSRGLPGAMNVFAKAYAKFPAFVSSGCHRQAHRVGDLAYYRLFFGSEDLERIDFTQDTTACGYGFYHGFLEHFTQDYPNVQAVTDTCTYLEERLGKTMGDIRSICYHGSGHGFTLAQSERVSRKDWGNVALFTAPPNELCDRLPLGNKDDIEQCKEGVFNVLVDWMVRNEYGFAYNAARPFAVCDRVPLGSRKACIYEMAQKVDGLSNKDPRKVAEITGQIPEEDLQTMAFGVAIAGFIQNSIAEEGGYQRVIDSCATLSAELYKKCMESVVHGLFEHGEPQKEYQEALKACAEPSVAEHTYTSDCYKSVAHRLPRFYSDQQILHICGEFPAGSRNVCESGLSKRP